MKYWKLAAVSGLCLMLGGCALLPAEEEYGMVPIAQKYEAADFQLAYVTRGEVVKTQKVNCTYLPVKSEDLYFRVNGYKIEDMYALEGQQVKAGELLAQLDLGNLETDISAMENRIETVKLQIAHLKENYALLQERVRIENAEDRRKLEERLEEIAQSHELALEDQEDQLYLLEMQLSDLKEKKSRRQIFAPSDGVITYARKLQEGEVSDKNSRMFTLVSSAQSIFRADTLYWDRFVPGDSYEIDVGRMTYPATCVDPVKDLGLEPEEKIEGKTAHVYLVLDDPNTDLKEGDKGTMTLVLEQRENVLRLPDKTVHEAQGKTLVYYQDENGLRSYKFIETGVEGGGWIEVLSGMEEGENVIIK